MSALAQHYPFSRLVPHGQFLLGQTQQRLGHVADAQTTIERLLQTWTDHPIVPEASVLLGHLYAETGDLVRASTYRREDVKTDKVRPERGEKVRVTLTVRVEGVEFQAFSDRLRITGVIVEGPQDLGRHHTLNVAPEDVLSVIKI